MPVECPYRHLWPVFMLTWKHDQIATFCTTNTAIPMEQDRTAPQSPQRAAQKCWSRIRHRRGGRRSLMYRDLRANRRDLRVRSALASLVHLSIHDCHPADVQPDRDGDGEGSSRVILEHYSKRVLYVTVSLLVMRTRSTSARILGRWPPRRRCCWGCGPFLACPH